MLSSCRQWFAAVFLLPASLASWRLWVGWKSFSKRCRLRRRTESVNPPPLPWDARTGPERMILLVSASMLLLGGALVLAATYLPVGWPCAWKAATDLPCAGCGGTRSAMLLLSGESAAALRMNPGTVIGIALVAAASLYALIVLCFRLEPWRPRTRVWVWCLASGVLLNWAYLLTFSRP